MGDVGDYWNEHREFKRAARSQWVACSSPGCQFGGNPVKVAPGSKCRHCGVRAPGQPGSDVRYARQDEIQREMDAEKAAERKAHKLKTRTCRLCGKVLGNEQGRVNHERDKHGATKFKIEEPTTEPVVVPF